MHSRGPRSPFEGGGDPHVAGMHEGPPLLPLRPSSSPRAHRDYSRRSVRPEEWLLVERPDGEAAPIRYWLSTMPSEISMEMRVRLAKVRWPIERDYEELRQEIGPDPFEGRRWRGFHPPAILCVAAYRFPAAERARLFPPSASGVPPRGLTTRDVPSSGVSRPVLSARRRARLPHSDRPTLGLRSTLTRVPGAGVGPE